METTVNHANDHSIILNHCIVNVNGTDQERIRSMEETIIYLERNIGMLMTELFYLQGQVKALNKSL